MRYLQLLVLLFTTTDILSQNKQFPEQEAVRWQPYAEWEVENTSYEGNPFDVEARAVFHHTESGESVETPLFYDGSVTWKFRFTGVKPGVWTLETVSQDKDLNGWTGQIVVKENPDEEAHGFITSFGSKWGWQGSEEAFVPQFVMGKDVHYYYDAASEQPDEQKIKADIREFVEEHGFTGFTTKIAQSWFDIAHQGPYTNPDIRTFRVLETLLKQVHQAGGACHLWMWGSDRKRSHTDGDGSRGILGEPMNEKDRRNLRYIAARLGPIPGWTMGYGVDTENGVATKEQLDHWKAYLEQHLGWDHFLGARVGYDEKGLWALEPRPEPPPHDEHYRSEIKDEHTFWLGGDYVGYTSYRPLYDRYVEAINHHPDRPSLEEDRFRLRNSEQWSYKDYSEELTRRGLWHSALAGGVANIWGNLLPEANHGGSNPYPIKDQIKTYARFFEDRFLKEMQTEKNGEVLSLRTPDHRHLIFYQEDTDEVSLDLNRLPHEMPAMAVDTKKAYREISIGPLSSEDQRWSAPYASDWVIAVGTFREESTPTKPTKSRAQTTEKWQVYELQLTSRQSYENPYTQVQLNATFTSPDGSQIRTTGYWSEDDRYIIRFTPTQEGKWTYTVSSNPADPGLQQQGELQVTGASPQQHGFVRRDAEHPYHFVYDDGTRYFMWGTTYYNMVLNALQGDRWKTAIDSAMEFGVNKIRVFANSTKSEKTPYPRQHPFQTISEDSILYDRLNPRYWQALDEAIDYAYRKGMVVDLMPFGYGGDVYGTDEQDRRYLRYVLARYAAYPNVIWCLVNEWNYIYRDHGKDKPYWNQLGRLVREEDPWMKNGDYLRPLSIHQQTRIDFQFFNYDWPVHAIVQYGVRNGQGTVEDEWDNTDPDNQPKTRHADAWGNMSITYNLGHDIPVVNDEYGYIGEPKDKSEATGSNQEDWPPFTRKKHRQVSWGIALAGGYGSTGDKNQYPDGHPYFSANWHSDPKEYEDIRHLINFFTSGSLEYWKMNSHNDLITAGERTYALAEPGQQYLFYAATGGQFEAQLLPGTYQAQLYNPRTGKYQDYGELAGGKTEFELPDGEDWVLLATTIDKTPNNEIDP